jgi:hypothetical protein
MVRFGILDPAQGREAYQWHRGFAGNGDCVYPRSWPAFEKWPRLFEQLSPIYKWTQGGLRMVTRGAPRGSSYAATFNCGKAAKYFSCGVSRSRLECGRCVLYQPR